MTNYSPNPDAAPQWLRDAASSAFALTGGSSSYSPNPDSAHKWLRDAASATNTLIGN